MMDLQYLYDRILRPEEQDPPGSELDLLYLADNAAAWEKALDGTCRDVDELILDFEQQPVIYLDEVERDALLDLLRDVRTVLDGELQTTFTELVNDCQKYRDSQYALRRYEEGSTAA